MRPVLYEVQATTVLVFDCLSGCPCCCLSDCPCCCRLQRNGPSVFMFGFMSLVFTMRERVESSMEMVRGGRTLGCDRVCAGRLDCILQVVLDSFGCVASGFYEPPVLAVLHSSMWVCGCVSQQGGHCVLIGKATHTSGCLAACAVLPFLSSCR